MTVIVGAGMAGLLAGAMLRSEVQAIMEKQPSLPNNHSAVLRFRSRVVSDVLNIPFQEVSVMKAAHPWRNPVADAMSYSLKTNKTATLRSVVSANGEVSRRYIAPFDLIERMYRCQQAPVWFNQGPRPEDWANRRRTHTYISTIPMPSLMKILGWKPASEFQAQPGQNIVARLKGVDAYCSLYVPDPEFPGARISITGSELIVECYDNQERTEDHWRFWLDRALELVGLTKDNLLQWRVKRQDYAKILPIDEEERKRFILWASEEFGIFSLGRFATWRPGLLLDDVVNDVRVIHRLMNGGSAYHHKK
jgi:hypothetical protein